MKVYLNDSLSILEYLYIKTVYEINSTEGTESSVELVNDISKADVIINLPDSTGFYDKTIIINNEGFDNAKLEELAKYNKVISRFPLPGDLLINYNLEPYMGLSKINNLVFNGKSKNVLSKLSVKNILILKNKNNYYMEEPFMYTHKMVKNHFTMIGLLDSFIKE